MIDGVEAGAFRYILTLRLIPLVPFWLVNIAAALAHAPRHAPATFLGIMPATFIYSSIGSGIGGMVARGQAPNADVIFEPRFLIPLAALSLLSLATTLFRHIWAKPGKGA